MNDTDTSSAMRAVRLRADFDASFALPRPPERPPQEQLLLVSVAGSHYIIPFAGCSAVVPAAALLELPAREPGFVGLSTVGGAVLPVYDLATRLDAAAPTSRRRPWLLVTAGVDRVAFLVDAVDGQVAHDRPDGGGHVPLTTIGGIARRYMSLPDVVATLSASVARPGAAGSIR